MIPTKSLRPGMMFVRLPPYSILKCRSTVSGRIFNQFNYVLLSGSTIRLLEEKVETLASEIVTLKEQPLRTEPVEKRNRGVQTSFAVKSKQPRRRHSVSEGCIQSMYMWYGV